MSQSTCCQGAALSEILTDDQRNALDAIIAEHRNSPADLISVLHEAQELVGYLPQEVQVRVAEGLGVPISEVFGVVSFYSLFATRPRGKFKISLCNGTACYVRGAPRVLDRLERELGVKPGDTSPDGLFSLDVVRCLGACGLGPVMTVNADVHARLKPDRLPALLNGYRTTEGE